MHSGGDRIHIDELSSEDAYIGVPGQGTLTVKSLGGTCVLAAGQHKGGAGGPEGGAGISVHLSGAIGTVVARTHGRSIACTLPQDAGNPSPPQPSACPPLQYAGLHSLQGAEGTHGMLIEAVDNAMEGLCRRIKLIDVFSDTLHRRRLRIGAGKAARRAEPAGHPARRSRGLARADLCGVDALGWRERQRRCVVAARGKGKSG